MMKILVLVLSFTFLVYCNGQKTCSGIDIRNERRFSMQKLSGNWYQHYYIDTTDYIDAIPKDGRQYVLPVGNTILSYISGRRPTGGPGCLTAILLNKPKTPISPCYESRLISPNLMSETIEYIFVLFPGDDVLLFAHCINPPSCTAHKVGVITRRSRLCPGERGMLNRKLKQLGFALKLNKPQRPNSNDCTFPGLPGFDKEKYPICKRRKPYGLK